MDLVKIVEAIVAFIKGIWGTSSSEKTTVIRPETEITDGKTDEERLNDLGL